MARFVYKPQFYSIERRMPMYKRLLRCVREYKTPSLLTLLFIALEAVIECFIPFIAADLINSVQGGATMNDILRDGLLLVVMAIASLCCGGIAGFTCAKASCGYYRRRIIKINFY